MPSEYMMKLALSFIRNIPDDNSFIRMLVFLRNCYIWDLAQKHKGDNHREEWCDRLPGNYGCKWDWCTAAKTHLQKYMWRSWAKLTALKPRAGPHSQKAPLANDWRSCTFSGMFNGIVASKVEKNTFMLKSTWTIIYNPILYRISDQNTIERQNGNWFYNLHIGILFQLGG